MSRATASDARVDQLAEDLASLSLEVQRLRQRVAELEGQLPGNSARSSSDFSLVEPQSVAPETNRVAGYSVGTEREQIARDIGRWLRRALDGRPRGPSGRDRIQLSSRYYVVCRDIHGAVHNPPLLFSSWRLAKENCFRQGEPGDAIFVGLPSKTEIEIALRAASLSLPAALGQQQ